jgi:hypothetical protein
MKRAAVLLMSEQNNNKSNGILNKGKYLLSKRASMLR